MTETKFILTKKDGSPEYTIETGAFKNAKATFAQWYSGKYVIMFRNKYGELQEKEVNL